MPAFLGVAFSVLAALERAPEHDAGQLRERARDLLSRPPYAGEEPGQFERALEWLGDLVARLLQAFVDGIAAGGAAGAWVVAAAGTALLSLVVWRFTRGAALDRQAPRIAPSASSRSAASWRAEAQQHDEAGRLREAVRCWYAAAVTELTQRGLIDDVPGRTVREISDTVARAAPELARPVTDAGDRFEAIVYGGQEATSDDVRVARRAADARAGVPT